MAKFRFFTSVCDYGVLEVEADNYDEALDKAYGLDEEDIEWYVITKMD
jgi:hypothetical protein